MINLSLNCLNVMIEHLEETRLERQPPEKEYRELITELKLHRDEKQQRLDRITKEHIEGLAREFGVDFEVKEKGAYKNMCCALGMK